VTYQPPAPAAAAAAEAEVQQLLPAAVDTPAGTDPTHARGGHGIFGEPMVSGPLYICM